MSCIHPLKTRPEPSNISAVSTSHCSQSGKNVLLGSSGKSYTVSVHTLHNIMTLAEQKIRKLGHGGMPCAILGRHAIGSPALPNDSVTCYIIYFQ